MEYLIDERGVYRVEENTLFSTLAPEQKVALTLTASRLLQTLLCHQGEVLPRATIFKTVWEDYGLEASNNTLTQYVSILRRTLLSKGILSKLSPGLAYGQRRAVRYLPQ